ncbi:MAG TPA: hypothetical protein PJ994_05425, partial [Tepidiformaceae bacterium]|nr:hypothetical protein [Tepidiformaceae bacterium]
MSKEIAQTVSGPKIAWLLAIVAAFAVLGTLATQWRTSEAVLPTTTFTLSQAPVSGNAYIGTSITYTATLVTSGPNTNGAVIISITVPSGVSLTGVQPTCPANDVGGAGITWAQSAAGVNPATCTSSAVLTAAVNTSMSITGTITGDTGTPSATVTDSDAPVITATLAAGVGAINALAIDTVPSLFHVDDFGDYILVQEVANNVRGSRHDVCMGLRVTDGGVLVDVLPFTAPGGTNFATHFQNQPANAYNGPQPVIPQSPTANDVSRYVSSTDGNTDGASCFSWYSVGAGDQIVTASYVDPDSGGDPPAPFAVDVLFDRNLAGQRGLVKEWNVLEDSVVSAVIWTPATGSQTAQTSTQNLNVTPAVGSPLNISLPLYVDVLSGNYNFNGSVTITDAFGGSHVNSGGQLEDFPSPGLVGVSWTINVSADCADWNTQNGPSGTTQLASTGSTSGLGFTVVNEPRIEIFDFSDCVLGDSIVVEIRGSEGALGSGTGLTVIQRVVITFTIPPPGQKQVFLAWAGQRILLEHDWRIPPGDRNDSSATATYPLPNGTCFGVGGTQTANLQVQAQQSYFYVTYIKGSGPGNFLPGYGAQINGSDQATVPVQVGNPQGPNPNGHCISRVLFESEDQGQVDIEAFIYNDGIAQVNVTKHAFVIYYMKINSVTTSLVTQVSKPNHNSTSAPDWAPGNPWNSSLDDADGAAEWNVSKDILARVRVTGWFLTTNPSGRPADTSNPLNILPANRWVMPDDWAQLHGGPIDVNGLNETTHNIGTAE